MSRKNKYQVDEVIRILSKKNDVKLDLNNKVVQILKGKKAKNDLGNGSFGKIDFLCNYNSFTQLYVNEFK